MIKKIISILIIALCFIVNNSFGAAVDITVLPDMGTPAEVTDSLLSYDSSAASGSRLTEIKFTAVGTECLNGQGEFVTFGDVSAAANITADALVCGDDGAKGIKECDAAISSIYLSTTDTGPADWIACAGTDDPVNGCVAASYYLASHAERKIECVAISDQTTAFTVDTALETIRAPYAFTLTNIRASVITAPTGAILIIDVNESGTTVITTDKLTIDATESTSTTAATAITITDSAIADDAVITFDIDQIGSSVAGAGAKVCLYGY